MLHKHPISCVLKSLAPAVAFSQLAPPEFSAHLPDICKIALCVVDLLPSVACLLVVYRWKVLTFHWRSVGSVFICALLDHNLKLATQHMIVGCLAGCCTHRASPADLP